MRLMIVRENARHAEATASHLTAVGFGTDCFNCLSDAGEAIASNPYDLILIESHLADGDTIKWLRGCGGRRLSETTFVIVLADREEERVAAFEAGADDCARPAVSARELVARVRAVLRRPRERVASTIGFGNISLCTISREVSVSNKRVCIQRRETAILEMLLRRASSVVPRAALEHDLYGVNTDYAPNSLEVRISCLRRHLLETGSSAAIETVRGIGYRLVNAELTATQPERPFRSRFRQKNYGHLSAA